MYGKLKRDRIKRRRAFRENAFAVLVGLLGFVLAVAADNLGISKKWVTATMGTLLTFGVVIYAFRPRLLRWSFWVSFTICLAIHVLAMWIFFQYALSGVERFPILLWLPIMLIEVFVLLIVVKRLEEKLSGKHETIKLTL